MCIWTRTIPIFSGLSSLKETVEVPLPPDFVVTIMSPLSFLACPTRHTILLADIHSAVRRQLCPQIVKPGRKKKKKKYTNANRSIFWYSAMQIHLWCYMCFTYIYSPLPVPYSQLQSRSHKYFFQMFLWWLQVFFPSDNSWDTNSALWNLFNPFHHFRAAATFLSCSTIDFLQDTGELLFSIVFLWNHF